MKTVDFKTILVIARIWTVAVCTIWSCNDDVEVEESSNKPVITINGQPESTTNVTAGSIIGSLSVSASVTQDATLSYQWYSNTTNSNSGGSEISGETSASFTIPTTLAAGTYYYFCEVRATDEATSVRSNVATVNVQATVPVIAINSQPESTTNVTADNITGSLNVSASVTQDATLSYQWYSNTTNSNTDGPEISGATFASFTIPITLAEGTYYYFCEVSATGGATSVRSNVAMVNVQAVTSETTEMVSVQGGTFIMGCTPEQGSDCYSGESPAHEVTLSSFSIGKCQVTQAQWLAVMDSWPSTAPNSSYGTGDNYPAYNVSWYDIVGTSGASEEINGITYYENGFIYKLNQLTGKKYRLPTEAEWEYAARGGNQSAGYKYSGSNTIGDVAWYWDNNSPNGTKPVRTKAPNELGIYDMSGNVYEWCSDWFSSTYYSVSPQNNPTGPATGSYRVARGGGWDYGAPGCRVAYRGYSPPGIRSSDIGFRLVLPL